MKTLFKSADKLQFKNNAILLPNREVFMIGSGTIALEAIVDGQETNIQFYKRGDIIDGHVLKHDKNLLPGLTFQFRCVGNVSLMRLPIESFDAADMDYVEQLQAQNRLLAVRLAGMSYKDVHRRLVARLLYLANQYGRTSDDQTIISLPITHRQLAQSVSSTRETVNKLIRHLSSQGVISMKSRTIRILSPSTLRQQLTRR